jgi:D-alanyl-lipoteichoic acid acyltransferase DltB (MBOAT superfamily)
LRQILWGLFKKVVIADNCATFANEIFNHSSDYSGSMLFIGALFFTFQIYGDFSGYSDIALGTARLLGIELLRNFAFPYFSRDIAEFWRRWHISLSSWFKDYLYIPLGGSKGGIFTKVRNTFIIFIVSGFWHGANWTFVIWGALNAIYFLPLLLTNKNRNNLETVAQGNLFPSVKELIQMLITFLLTVLAWIFFRANNVEHAINYILDLFSNFSSYLDLAVYLKYRTIFLFIAFFMAIEWLGREQQFAIAKFGFGWKKPLRWIFYLILAITILLYSGKGEEFIYFQF